MIKWVIPITEDNMMSQPLISTKVGPTNFGEMKSPFISCQVGMGTKKAKRSMNYNLT